MAIPRGVRIFLRAAAALLLAFIYLPIGIIVLYSFNAARVATWPIRQLTLDWYVRALGDAGIRSALIASLQAAIGATIVSLVLGSLIAFAVQRYRFFGRETISFVVILPLALPGIVTGHRPQHRLPGDRPAARPAHDHRGPRHVLHRGHLQQRDRATAPHLAFDRGGFGGPWRRHVRDIPTRDDPGHPHGADRRRPAGLRPVLRRDHRDELHVRAGTQTLPLWIFSNFQRPNQLPLVNVAAVLVLLLSIVPVYLASRLTADPATVAGART